MYYNCTYKRYDNKHIEGLVQDCSNSTANELELPQSCPEPSISSTMCQIDGLAQKIRNHSVLSTTYACCPLIRGIYKSMG